MLLVQYSGFVYGDQVHFSDKNDPILLAEKIVSSMSDTEALGQILMFGYRGEEPDAGILRWISEGGLGGVKIFGWNAENLETLANTIGHYQKRALESQFGVPLLIATDQEGGWVQHIKGDASITPGNMALGADPIIQDSLETGRIIGRELAAVGVNMNFAPTVDIYVNPEADVIGSRAFMADPHLSGIRGMAFTKGQEEYGVISTAKHFPGHGDTSEDSHGTLPLVSASMDTLRKRDLVPFETLIMNGIPAIMVGHLAFPEISGNRLPATLSKEILQDLLRDEMGFEGVAITDDLLMYGVRMDGSPMHKICYQAVMAGADILLISQDEEDYWNIQKRLLKHMEEDASFHSRVRESARRVIRMKKTWLTASPSVPFFPEFDKDQFLSEDSKAFFLAQAARSITLIRNERFPLPPNKAGKVLLAGTHSLFFSEGLKRYPESDTWNLIYENTRNRLKKRGRDLAKAAASYDTVITLLPDQDMAILLNELKQIAEKIILISVLSPAHLDELDWAQTTLAAYGTGEESFRAAFAALAGDFPPEGELPIPLKSVP